MHWMDCLACKKLSYAVRDSVDTGLMVGAAIDVDQGANQRQHRIALAAEPSSDTGLLGHQISHAYVSILGVCERPMGHLS
jgi:hypothetical protein